MSDETKAPEAADPLKNLKAEFDRKLGNADSKLAELQKTNELLMAKIQAMNTPAPVKKETSLTDLLYSDPEAYAREIESRAEAKALARVTAQQEKMNKVSNTIGALVNEYPELQDNGHSLSKRAVEIFSSLPDEEKQSSLSYKMAVKDAAEELGIKPRSKRPVDEEPSFSGSYRSSSRSRKKEGISPVTEAWAEALGVNLKDEKVKARVLENQSRDWTKYKPIK